MATEEKKWRHHYVQQYHLKAWVGADKKLWYEQDGVRTQETTKAIAYTRDFYRLQDIPDEQMTLVEGLIAGMHESVQGLARGWIPHFRAVFQLERVYLASGKTDPTLENELDVKMSNLEEDLHGHFENLAVAPLAKLRTGDAAPLLDEASVEFATYLGLQYFRTPKVMAAAVEAAREVGFDLRAAWGLLRTIFATNVARGLYLQRKTLRIVFLDAGPKSEFITSDQPLLNLGGQESLDLYYPLGPRRAVRLTLLHENPGVETKTLTDDETLDYNRLIAKESEAQIYGSSEAALIAART